jgi:hypothetical protein
MTDSILMFLGAFSIVFQLSAAYIAYSIYRFDRMSKWWLVIVFAFILMGVRRVFALWGDFSLLVVGNEVYFDRSLAFLTSLLVNIGLWSMMKSFHSFDLVAKKVRDKAKKFAGKK